MRCPNCGFVTFDDVKDCKKCGYDLQSARQGQPASKPSWLNRLTTRRQTPTTQSPIKEMSALQEKANQEIAERREKETLEQDFLSREREIREERTRLRQAFSAADQAGQITIQAKLTELEQEKQRLRRQMEEFEAHQKAREAEIREQLVTEKRQAAAELEKARSKHLQMEEELEQARQSQLHVKNELNVAFETKKRVQEELEEARKIQSQYQEELIKIEEMRKRMEADIAAARRQEEERRLRELEVEAKAISLSQKHEEVIRLEEGTRQREKEIATKTEQIERQQAEIKRLEQERRLLDEAAKKLQEERERLEKEKEETEKLKFLALQQGQQAEQLLEKVAQIRLETPVETTPQRYYPQSTSTVMIEEKPTQEITSPPPPTTETIRPSFQKLEPETKLTPVVSNTDQLSAAKTEPSKRVARAEDVVQMLGRPREKIEPPSAPPQHEEKKSAYEKILETPAQSSQVSLDTTAQTEEEYAYEEVVDEDDLDLEEEEGIIPKGGLIFRTVAGAIDLSLLIAIIAVFMLIGKMIAGAEMGGMLNMILKLGLPYYVLFIILAAAYFTYMHGVYGQTLGKRILHLKVLTTHGEELGYLTAFFRFVMTCFAFGFLGMGIVWLALDPNKQGWHDKLSRTVVIRL